MADKFCSNCGNELKEGAKFCDKCGKAVTNDNTEDEYKEPTVQVPPVTQQVKKKKNKGCLIGFIIFILIVVGLGASINKATKIEQTANTNQDSSANNKQSTNQNVSKRNLELVGETTSTNDGYAISIEGTVKNNRSTAYSYVQITFGIYDKNGNKVGSAMDNVNNLGSGETWKFKAICLNSPGNGWTYKLDEITGY
ncbi:MAG: zinc ribbon domain-containing protein [Clostridia bacterium]|nr:zinc ribbon domain-containing protein [Clostridia bacterium]